MNWPLAACYIAFWLAAGGSCSVLIVAENATKAKTEIACIEKTGSRFCVGGGKP